MASQDFLTKAYLAYFGRPVDVTGQAYWATRSEAEVIAGFSASNESRALYGDEFNVQQINAIYNNLFNRDAEPDGLNYWLNQVFSGAVAPLEAALAILNGAANEDKTAIENKLAASRMFTEGLDTTTEILGYNGPEAAAAARAFLSTVTTTVPTQVEVDAAVASVTGVGGAPGESFTLTTGLDVLPGTSGNDTFHASNATWNVGDSLDGGAGVDTLIIANENEELSLAGRTLTNLENVTIVNADPNASAAQDFNFANQPLQQVTIDFASTDHSQDVYLDNLRADTDLVVTNVLADGNSIYRNDDGVYSALTGSVSQSNTFSNIDGSVNDYYVYFENNAYFTAATELNLSETWTNVTNGGETGSGSDDSYAYSENNVDLAADNAVVNMTYNLTNVVVPDGYSYLELYVDNEATVDKADTVNVTYNLNNVDGIYAYVDTYNTGVDGESDTVTINANGVANTDGNNDFELYYFENVNINVTAESDLGELDVYTAAAAQTINIVANANLTIDDLDAADDHEVTINISGAGNVSFDMNGDNHGVTVNAAEATGDLDLGVGSDATYATVVTSGSGNDTITLLNAFQLNADNDAFLQVLDGGDGVDTFEINTAHLVTSQAHLGSVAGAPEDFSDAIKNFERLSLAGFSNQVIDATTMGFDHVTINGYTTGGSLTVDTGATVVVTGAGATDLKVIVDDAATGTADSLNLVVEGADGITLAALTVDDVETINLTSSASDADETAPGANVVALEAAEAVVLNISGATELDLTGSTFTDLATVNAAGFDAGLTIDVSSAGQAVTITTGSGADNVVGSDYNDIINVGNGGNTVEGGAGKDTINLGNGATADDVDTIVYGAVGDSQGVTVDVINGFQVNVQATTDTNSDNVVDATDLINDVIDLSAIVIGTATYAGEANGYGAVLTSLTGNTSDSQAVLDTSTSTLYVDVNADGVLDSNDMAILLTGVTDLSAANFAF